MKKVKYVTKKEHLIYKINLMSSILLTGSIIIFSNTLNNLGKAIITICLAMASHMLTNSVRKLEKVDEYE